MVQSVTYQSETKTVPFQGKSIVLESLTPVLSPKEKEKRKKDILKYHFVQFCAIYFLFTPLPTATIKFSSHICFATV